MAQTRTQTQQRQGFNQAAGGSVAVYQPRLPFEPKAADYGIDQQAWNALVDAIFPNAKTAGAVMLALACCKARKLDVFRKPVHIVPVWSSAAKRLIEGVWPAIAEYRITAHRTGQFAGQDECAFGPEKTSVFHPPGGGNVSVTHPEWAQITVYKLVGAGANVMRVAIPGPKVIWRETYAPDGHDSEVPNSMWRRRTVGQIEKCAEAAALRRAFPEEIGSLPAAEEMEGQIIDVDGERVKPHVPTQAAVQQHQAQQVEAEAYVYEVILDGGEVRETTDAAEALTLIADAIKAPGADPGGIWESNAPILDLIAALGEKAASNVQRLAELRDATAKKTTPAGEASSAPAGGAAGNPGQVPAVATDDNPPAFLWVPTAPKNDKEAEYLAEQIMVRLEPFPGSVRRQWYERNAATYVAISDRLTKMGSPLAAALKAFIEAVA